MPIFIAKTYTGKTESIVLAKNRELANVYWQGKDIYAHSIKEFSEKDLIEHSTGVIPIMNTLKRSLSYQGGIPKDYLVVTK